MTKPVCPWLPPEWHPQLAVMLTWPHPDGAWAGQLQQIDRTFARIGLQISLRQKLLLICRDSQHQQHVTHCLQQQQVKMENVVFHLCDSNDSWARDHGPITVLDTEKTTLLDFNFNGWGNKYPAAKDNQINQSLIQSPMFSRHHLRQLDFVLEGGAIDTDGKGTFLCTRNSILNTNRNNTSQEAAELLFKQEFSATKLLWLNHGHLIGDDTDSHIDTLARFCNENLIVYESCSDENDAHFQELKKMQQELQQFTNIKGVPYQLKALPLPQKIFNTQGQRLPASYANFLIINKAVLVPLYNDPNDSIALKILAQCFKQREIIGIDCSSLIEQFGSLHCIAMQIPQNTLLNS